MLFWLSVWLKVFLQSCLSNKIISWPSFRNPECLSIRTLITLIRTCMAMQSNYNMGSAAFHFHSCHGTPSPPTAVEVTVNFDFLFFFQCVLMVSLYQTGGNLWRNPAASCPRGPASRKQDCRLWMRHLQEHLRAASIKKRKERERDWQLEWAGG